MPKERSIDPIRDFEHIADSIYGAVLDADRAFALLLSWFQNSQQEVLRGLSSDVTRTYSIDYLDALPVTYGTGGPDGPTARILHECTQGEYKARNSRGGANSVFIGAMALVSLYQLWEDHYRRQIADYLGMTKEHLSSPIMGDIRLLRNDLVHHGGTATKRISRCSLLLWFAEGDTIRLDAHRFREILTHIKQMLRSLTKA